MQAPSYFSTDDIARALQARRSGRGWLARCIAHDDRTPSLSIADGDGGVPLLHCFAGCSPVTIIAELRARGLWSNAGARPRPPRSGPRRIDDAPARIRAALGLWSASVPITGSLAQRYIVEHRGLDISCVDLAHVLRWNPRKRALIALMTDPVSGEACGVHRTFLDADGAKIERKMLGRQGVIRVSPDECITTSLGVAEGLEDAIAILLSGWSPIWAATSSGAIACLPVIGGIEALTLFADADLPGIRAAEACRARWQNVQRECRIVTPEGARHV